MNALGELRAELLTEERYAPFGSLVAARPTPGRSANHGTAEAWDDLAPLVNTRGAGARPTVSLFRCAPHEGHVLAVDRLERHPFSTQLFVPMGPARYLVVVARGRHAPDPQTLAAFIVEGPRAITYHAGTWHHPMVALDAATDFVNLLFADGSAGDCEERSFEPPLAIVHIPPLLP